MRSLFVHPNTWDLTLDVHGNITVASDLYRIAQDVATACRTFARDVYYDQELGIPYFEHILGSHGYPLALYKMHLEDAARSVEGVATANAQLQMRDRVVTGTIAFSTPDGQNGSIEL